MTLKPDHPCGQHRVFQIGELLLDHAALLIPQLLGQHLLCGGSRHAAEVLLLRSDVKHHRVAFLGVVRHLHHLLQGDLVVFAFHLLHDDFARQNPVALFLQVESDIEIAEVLLVKGVFADTQIHGAPITLVALQQGFAQGRFHHLRRQLLLFADVVDQVAEAWKQNESHWVGVSEVMRKLFGSTGYEPGLVRRTLST